MATKFTTQMLYNITRKTEFVDWGWLDVARLAAVSREVHTNAFSLSSEFGTYKPVKTRF